MEYFNGVKCGSSVASLCYFFAFSNSSMVLKVFLLSLKYSSCENY